jgi:hypothetical protein
MKAAMIWRPARVLYSFSLPEVRVGHVLSPKSLYVEQL